MSFPPQVKFLQFSSMEMAYPSPCIDSKFSKGDIGMARGIEKKLAFLQVYGVVLTAATAVVAWLGLARRQQHQRRTRFKR